MDTLKANLVREIRKYRIMQRSGFDLIGQRARVRCAVNALRLARDVKAA